MFAKLKDMADFVEMGKFRHDVSGSLCGGPLLGQVRTGQTIDSPPTSIQHMRRHFSQLGARA